MPGYAQDHAHFRQLDKQGGAAIAEKRQGDAGGGEQSRHHADVQKHLHGQLRGKAHRQQRAEPVTGVEGDPVASKDQRREQQHDDPGSHQTQFLAGDGENEIVVLLRQKQEFLPALTEAQSPQPAGANGNEALGKLIALIRGKIGDINASLQDTLSGIRVVQSFANEDLEREKFKKSNHAFLLSKNDNYHCMGSFMSSNLFFQGLMYLITLVYGGYLIARGQMQAADLAMYALYIGIFISPIQILVELVEMMQKGLSGFRRFLDVMETVPEIQDAPDAVDLTNVKGRVCYEDVSFHYSDDDTTVLSNVSIEIPAGRSVALVGPSGSGKTTICSLLPRFYDVTAGRITIDDQDIRHLTLKSLRSQIGMVQQDVYLFSGTIRDNIAYGKPDASDEEIIAAAKRANIHDFIMELPQQYETFVGERGARLSGGQKQRISIARVFLKNPPILILDEATSALDNESERKIQKSLEELSKNRTTITIAHRLSTIKGSDEIIVITENGIAERGTHEFLLQKGGIYAKYYQM